MLSEFQPKSIGKCKFCKGEIYEDYDEGKPIFNLQQPDCCCELEEKVEGCPECMKELRERVRELEEREKSHLKQLNEILDRSILHIESKRQAEARIKELEKERRINAIDGQCALDEANNRIKELESDLKLNTSMLANQCNLARDAETERDRLSKLLIEERMKTVELRKAIEKHKSYMWGDGPVDHSADEELYKTRKGVV